ncbi:hypothetical protein SAMN05216345_111131 [Cupriavidus sp. YR651]|uniref:DUF6988 family protein n=1 Tax=Cupriavidus sp. YR651 TaxID=1855315 RepID=UPI0008871D41|nr:hypothetical protein [Cupriavidus sp. YR651]SDD58159.1 hypothetical protein SAMN05216345_111131 [Cupriavidus sp. YR651]
MSNDFLSRSAELHSAAVACIGQSKPGNHLRIGPAYQCALMSVEHAAGAVALVTFRMPNAAMALFRPQFETLVRGVWLLEAANEKWVRHYHEPLTEESVRAADKAPSVKGMFDELLALEDPRAKGIVAHLDEYRVQSIRAMNSFTHGGMHPMSRSGAGYPLDLIENVVRRANGLVCYAAQMAALVSTNPQANMVPVRKLNEDFRDCLPPHKGVG